MISYYDSSGTRDTFTKPFSEQTARDIDTEVRRIIEAVSYTHLDVYKRQVQQLWPAMRELRLDMA